MLFFSGVPERWRNLSRPAAFVISANTIGAPSTNPPAVIGLDWASFLGAWATPVETPIGGACWGFLSGTDSWLVPKVHTSTMYPKPKDRCSRLTSRPLSLRRASPQVRPLAGSDRP